MTSCIKKKKESVEPINTNALVHEVTIEKTIQASAYTYLFVNEGGQTYWVAVEKMDPETAKTYYYADAMEMKEFHSNDLDTTFAQVFFVQNFSTSKEAVIPAPAEPKDHPKVSTPGRREIAKDETVKIEPAAGGIAIGQLFAKRADYADKSVIVRGKVVKVNEGIMNRNWVHIQDGTDFEGEFDLTLTTAATVAVGDVVTFEGKVALNKDFGAGYVYDLIIESAELKDKTSAETACCDKH